MSPLRIFTFTYCVVCIISTRRVWDWELSIYLAVQYVEFCTYNNSVLGTVEYNRRVARGTWFAGGAEHEFGGRRERLVSGAWPESVLGVPFSQPPGARTRTRSHASARHGVPASAAAAALPSTPAPECVPLVPLGRSRSARADAHDAAATQLVQPLVGIQLCLHCRALFVD